MMSRMSKMAQAPTIETITWKSIATDMPTHTEHASSRGDTVANASFSSFFAASRLRGVSMGCKDCVLAGGLLVEGLDVVEAVAVGERVLGIVGNGAAGGGLGGWFFGGGCVVGVCVAVRVFGGGAWP